MADMDDLYGDEDDKAMEKDEHAFAEQRKQIKQLNKELEELRAFKEAADKEARKASTAEAFKGLGLNPKHATFYTGDDISTDAIKTWAMENELLTSEGEPDEATPPAPEAGFTPTVISGGTAIGSKVYTAEEFEALARKDPAKAMDASKAGKVQKEQPWTVGKPMSFVHDSLD